MLRKAYLLLLVLVLIPCTSHAKTETIFANHVYLMGDNDSKNDARRICFIEAKRKVLEKTGTFIQSSTQVRNYQLTKDEISTYSAALLKVETVKEEWKLVGHNMAIDISVKAMVDTSKIENQLSKINQDQNLKRKIKEQQRQLEKLEQKFITLQNKISSADSSEALILRKEKTVVFKEINALQERKIQITSQIKTKTKNVLDYIELGMMPSEVESLVGAPRSIDCQEIVPAWNYGKVWVIFEGGVVSCIVRSTSYSACRPRKLYKHETGSIVK